jgi:uncharacterized protein YkwD
MRTTIRIAALVAAALLAACGGGGGGSSTGGGGTTTTGFTATCADGSTQTSGVSQTDANNKCGTLASSAPAPTYTAGSDNLHAFQLLNQVRIAGGFGALTQSLNLDAAASNHMQYVFANDYAGGVWNDAALTSVDPATGWITAHVEVAGKAQYTGVLPMDRAVAAGYSAFYVDENVAPTYTADVTSGLYPGCVETLLASVFHRNGILNPELRDIGIAIGNSSDGVANLCVIDPAFTSANRAVAPAGWVGVYPSPSQTGVLTTIPFGESPDPVPTSPVKGNPVSVYVEPSKTLTVTAFTLTDASGATVPTKQLTKADFPNSLAGNAAYLVPTQALAANTSYTVHFVGSASGAAVAKDWSFKTGAK